MFNNTLTITLSQIKIAELNCAPNPQMLASNSHLGFPSIGQCYVCSCIDGALLVLSQLVSSSRMSKIDRLCADKSDVGNAEKAF